MLDPRKGKKGVRHKVRDGTFPGTKDGVGTSYVTSRRCGAKCTKCDLWVIVEGRRGDRGPRLRGIRFWDSLPGLDRGCRVR